MTLPAGNDNQTAHLTNTAIQYPDSVDALPGMQAPDMPGGPDVNAPINPQFQQTVEHYPAPNPPPVEPEFVQEQPEE